MRETLRNARKEKNMTQQAVKARTKGNENLQCLAGNEAKMLQPERNRIWELWWQRNNRLPRVVRRKWDREFCKVGIC